jgi:hypothetical protein
MGEEVMKVVCGGRGIVVRGGCFEVRVVARSFAGSE